MIAGRRRRHDERSEATYAEQVAELARGVLDPAVFSYVAQGAGVGATTGEAVDAWRRVRLRPRILQDVTSIDLGASLLGAEAAVPLGIAPTTLQRAAHPDGEVEMARAAADLQVPMVVSSNAGSTFADVAATGVTWWLQMYVTADRSVTEPVVAAAVQAGASALVLTADTPVVARKRLSSPSVWDVVDPAWLRVNFPGGDSEAAMDKAGDLGPQDIAWLSERFGLPVVVKGVLRGDDARRCVDAGASAVWVSNHGGRQLDRAVSTCAALPEVRAAVDQAVAEREAAAQVSTPGSGPVQVFVDGGLRTGLDVLVALACGADAAFLGRPPLFALAHQGADGVRRLWEELASELEEALLLAGLSTVGPPPRDLVWPGPDGAVPSGS